MAEEYVILVDENDRQIGTMGKLEAHEKALRHRAFSIFVTRKNADGQTEYLLQQRNPEKYHSGGLWANSCCGHPRPGEDTADGARRRLYEETGLDLHNLQEIGVFTYKAALDKGLTEYEVDHVFTAEWNGETLNPAPQEIMATAWLTRQQITNELNASPHKFAAWFAKAFHRII